MNDTKCSSWFKQGSECEVYLDEDRQWCRANITDIYTYFEFWYYTPEGNVYTDSYFYLDDILRLPLSCIPQKVKFSFCVVKKR